MLLRETEYDSIVLCQNWPKNVPKKSDIRCLKVISFVFFLVDYRFNICNVYMGCWREIYDSIAPKPRLFSSEVKKCPRARPAAWGHFLTEDEKSRGWGGYTVVLSPTTPHICNIYTTSDYFTHFLYNIGLVFKSLNISIVIWTLDLFSNQEPHLQLDRKPFKRKGNILMMCQILVLIWFFRKRNIKKLLI